MAWGLEARVPFLDKAFLEVAMNIDPKGKQFSKGASQETDEDGCPKMEKYILRKAFDVSPDGKVNLPPSTAFNLPSFFQVMEHSRIGMRCFSRTSLDRSSGVRKNSSLMGSGILG